MIVTLVFLSCLFRKSSGILIGGKVTVNASNLHKRTPATMSSSKGAGKCLTSSSLVQFSKKAYTTLLGEANKMRKKIRRTFDRHDKITGISDSDEVENQFPDDINKIKHIRPTTEKQTSCAVPGIVITKHSRARKMSKYTVVTMNPCTGDFDYIHNLGTGGLKEHYAFELEDLVTYNNTQICKVISKGKNVVNMWTRGSAQLTNINIKELRTVTNYFEYEIVKFLKEFGQFKNGIPDVVPILWDEGKFFKRVEIIKKFKNLQQKESKARDARTRKFERETHKRVAKTIKAISKSCLELKKFGDVFKKLETGNVTTKLIKPTIQPIVPKEDHVDVKTEAERLQECRANQVKNSRNQVKELLNGVLKTIKDKIQNERSEQQKFEDDEDTKFFNLFHGLLNDLNEVAAAEAEEREFPESPTGNARGIMQNASQQSGPTNTKIKWAILVFVLLTGIKILSKCAAGAGSSHQAANASSTLMNCCLALCICLVPASLCGGGLYFYKGGLASSNTVPASAPIARVPPIQAVEGVDGGSRFPDAPRATSGSFSAPPPDNRTTLYIIIGFAIFAILICCCGALAYAMSKDDDSPADDYSDHEIEEEP